MNFQKITAAAIGLTVLAGLAMHQGNTHRKGVEDTSVLVGTALEESSERAATVEPVPAQAQNQQADCTEPGVNSEQVPPQSTDCKPETEAGKKAPDSSGSLTGF